MKTLRQRLTALYTVTTGSILLLIITAFLLSSVKESRAANLEQFQVVWNSLSSRFQSSSAFSHGFLAQTEADSHMIIHIRENGFPLLYHGAWNPKTDRELLIAQAREMAQAEGVFMDKPPVSSLMTLEGQQGEQYYAMVLALATKNGVKSLCAIASIPPIWESLRTQVLHLGLLFVLGILLLWLISWKFVGWSLKPVEESRKKQVQFIAAASHELRSPLAVLRFAVAAMASSPQQKDTLLPLIDSECVRMSRLVDDMLLLASADAKTWNLQIQEVDMDTLLIELFETFQPVCKEKGISLSLNLPDETLPVIQGDSERIRQILVVLLDNAMRYTPSGRSIYLKAQTNVRKHVLELSVADEGCGILPEQKPYIFDRFYQADLSRNDKQHFGLGLSIALELAQLHHGSIDLSDSPAGGSCFTVSLPYL